MKRVLTGLQPTGNITLGNYIGAIKQMKELENNYDSYLFVADLHSITVAQDPNELRKNTRKMFFNKKDRLFFMSNIDRRYSVLGNSLAILSKVAIKKDFKKFS